MQIIVLISFITENKLVDILKASKTIERNRDELNQVEGGKALRLGLADPSCLGCSLGKLSDLLCDGNNVSASYFSSACGN